MDGHDAKMNSISSTWSHLPFRRRHMAPASRCPFVKAHIIQPQYSEKKIWDISHPQQGNGRCGLCAAVKNPFCQCPGALRNLTLPFSDASRPLLAEVASVALSDITTDTGHRGLAGRYYSLTFLCLLQLIKTLALHLSCKVRGAESDKLLLDTDKAVNVISHSL